MADANLRVPSKPMTREEILSMETPLHASSCRYSYWFREGIRDEESRDLNEEESLWYDRLFQLECKVLEAVKNGHRVYGELNEDKSAVVYYSASDTGRVVIDQQLLYDSDMEVHKFQLIGFYFCKPISIEAWKLFAYVTCS